MRGSVGLSNKVIENFNIFLDDNLLYYGNRYFTYKEILDATKKYKDIKGRVIYHGEKNEDYIIIFFASLIYKFTIIPIDKKQPKNRVEIIKKDSSVNYEYTGKNLSLINDCFHKHHPQYIIYTSGTTGVPKGVMISSETIYPIIENQIKTMDLKNEDIFLFVSIGFDASISDILCSFFSGSCLYIDDSLIKKPKDLKHFLIDKKITYIDIPPSYLRLIEFKNSSVKKILVGGEPFQFNLIKGILDQNIKVFNAYGPTETTICTSLAQIIDEDISIGLPFPHIKYIIKDSKLYIGGNCLAIGYTNEDETKKKFIEHNGERIYSSGDIITYKNNKFYFIGRDDSQIKKNGQLINLEEIESILSNNFNDDFIVKYEDDKITVYYKSDALNNYKDFLLKNLPQYMQPSVYKKINRFPLTIRNKKDRKSINHISFILTGATGFLGVFLLKELIENTTSDVYCIIRGALPFNRLCDIYKKYTLSSLDEYKGRINIINKDINMLTKEDFHFVKNTDVVIHSAANVNNLGKIDILRKQNIDTTKLIEKLLPENKKILISTLSVQASVKEKKPKLGEWPLNYNLEKSDFNNDYAYSKYLCEKAINLNLNWSVIRLGLLVADSINFIEPSKSFLKLLLISLHKEESIPLIKKELKIDYSPVDLSAKIIFKIINSDIKQQFHHVCFNQFITWDIIKTALNKEENPHWFMQNKYKLVANFFGNYNPHIKRPQLNIFESTDIDNFEISMFIEEKLKEKVFILMNEYIKRNTQNE